MGADACAYGDGRFTEDFTYISGMNPAEYDGSITDVYIYNRVHIVNLRVGMMKNTTPAIGGATELFDVGAGGDYDTDIEISSGGCAHLQSGVDFTEFSCDAGEYAGAWWEQYIGNSGYVAKQSGSNHTYSTNTFQRYALETDDIQYGREYGYEIQMYFVNTL